MRVDASVRAWCVAAALAVAASQRVSAQTTEIDRLVGRTITAIHLDAEGRRNDDPALLALIDIARGQPLDLVRLRLSIAQLQSGGRFDDIRVRGALSTAGVELIFELVPRHPVDRVTFAGLSAVSADDLERDLRQTFNGLPRGAQADAAARSVERALADRGYRQAVVRPTIETSHTPDRATMVLTVDVGPLTVVTSARVEGVSPLAPAAVLKRVGVAVGQPYRSRDIDLGLDAIIEDLRQRGYYDATVSHARDVVAPDGRSAQVVISVESAVPVTVKFAGDPLPGRAADLVPITREGSADDDLLEDSVRRIESALRREGYWRGRASFKRTSTSTSTLVTITVARGLRYRFERLDVTGNAHITTDAISAMVAVEHDALFDESRVARGVAAIREAYLLQGFATATVTVTASELPPAKPNGDPRVVERFVIDEGVQTRIADVTVSGATRLSPTEVLGPMRLKRDGPYIAALVAGDREAIRQKYDERGYGAAVVELRPKLTDDRTRATIQVDIVSEGPQTILDHIVILGNRRVSEETIRNVVALSPGQPLGTSARQALQQRLSAMGSFRRVAITEAPHPGGASGTDIVITVEESPTTTIVYGGGVEAGFRARSVLVDGDLAKKDKFELAPRASFEIGKTNIGGKSRSATFTSGVSLRPIDNAANPDRDGKCCEFSQYRAVASLRQQRLFDSPTDGLVSLSVEQAIRNTFDFVRQNVGLQLLHRRNARTTFIGGYSLERVRLYNAAIEQKDQLLVDRLFPQVRLSVLSSSVLRDTRNDQLSPTDGGLLSADANLAMRGIGSQVGFAKVFLQGFVYRRLEQAPRVVLAGGARLGLVRGFAQTIDGVDVELVPASQRFFSGGSTTVRGFQQDRLGTPGILDGNGLSNGGNGLMVFNAEVRTALTRDLGLAMFLDAGNVFPRVGEMHFSDLRTSMGAGLRYRSPLGPLRVDIGWKLGALRISDSRRWEFHFSIGEAF